MAKVVEAAGIASASTAFGDWTARELEAVMSKAATEVMATGEQDTNVIRQAMIDAKEQFKLDRKAGKV